jgi:hypothetical protein
MSRFTAFTSLWSAVNVIAPAAPPMIADEVVFAIPVLD